MNNRPIDNIRNSSVAMTLPTNVASINKMVEINGSLCMIGNDAIYLVQLADEIDPQRNNIALPDTNQQILSVGTKCAYVSQTLITASRLFCDSALGSDFNCKKGINLSFDALQDLVAMHDILKFLRSEFEKIHKDHRNFAVRQRLMTLPSIGDMRGKTYTFLQKSDHILIDLFDIAKLFYSDRIGEKLFDSLHKLARENYGDNHKFTKFLDSAVPFLKFVRDTRNAMEHPKSGTNSINVDDISLMPNGKLSPPSITVVLPDQKIMTFPMPLLDFMGSIVERLALIFEEMLMHLCSVHIKPFAGIPLIVMEYDENQQRAYKCRYGYGGEMKNGIVPFG